MKALHAIAAILLAAAAPADESSVLLEKFRAYRQGESVALLAATRQAVFRATEQREVRAERERQLLALLATDAHPQAKAIAIEWLGCLGSASSVPALAAATRDPALAGPAAAALEQIPGPEAARARLPRTPNSPTPPKPPVAAVLEFTAAIAAEPTSAATDERLLAVLGSDNELLRGAALRQIRAGAGSADLPAKALKGLRGIPAETRPLLLESLAARPGNAESLQRFLAGVIREAPQAEQVVALRALGPILRPDEAGRLLAAAAAAGANEELAQAARAALTRATGPGIDEALVAAATAPDAGGAALAIALLADRQSVTAVTPLWRLARGQDPARATLAVAALGDLLPPDDLPKLIDWLAGPVDPAVAAAGSKALWSVLRRHPDPAAAAATVEQALPKAPPALRETLAKFAARIRPKAPAPKPAATLDLPAGDDRSTLAPNGFSELACLDCGSATEANAGGVTIRRLKGSSHTFGNQTHPLATVDFGTEIAYEITGLQAAADHALGLSAWDADRGGRRQTVTLDDQTLLPSFPPLAYHADQPSFTRLHLPVPKTAAADGKLTLRVSADAGPNAVLSQLWVLQRAEPPQAAAKRVLILTGDDFPGHRWRETGPEFATILRADPRLEVTVSESPFLLASPTLAAYDAVFLHFKNYPERLPTGAALWRKLESYVHGGGGLVVAHFGCGALQEWNGFAKLAGRIWDPRKRGHDPYGEFLVRITSQSHPATRGLADFTTRDELYTCLSSDTPVAVLAEANSKVDQSTHPMAFVLTPGKGRVFHCPLGHDTPALKSPGTRALYLRGTLWAAGS